MHALEERFKRLASDRRIKESLGLVGACWHIVIWLLCLARVPLAKVAIAAAVTSPAAIKAGSLIAGPPF